MEAARADWVALRTDDEARFDKELRFDAADVGPMVTWGTSPEEVANVTASVPREEHLQASRDYMGLEAGQEISGIAVDQVFIGSCTNSRIQDLREAASVLQLGRVTIPTMIVPGSAAVKKAAEAEGLDRIFLEAGAQWRDSGCSMCVAMNGDAVAPGKRCASTSNRNFPGRQGRGARTHLMSPAMAAAAALTGHIVDVRTIGLQPEAGAGR